MGEDELKGIVEKMVAAGEPEENIKLVIENYKPSETTPQKSTLQKVGNIGGLVAGGFLETLSSTPVKFLGAVDETLWNGIYSLIGKEPNYESAATRGGQKIQKLIESGQGATPEMKNSFGGQVAQGLGTGLAMMGTGGASLLTKTGGLATKTPSAVQTIGNTLSSPTAVLGGAMTSVPEYEAAKAAGVPNDELFGVLAKNYLVGQTEALPIEKLFGRLHNVTGGTILDKIKKVGVASGIGSFEEATQEGIQNYLTNEIAKSEYDPERDPFWNLAQSMAVGGVVGAILPGVAGAIANIPPSKRAALEPKIRELHQLHDTSQEIDQTISSPLQGASPEATEAITSLDKDVNEALVVRKEQNTPSEVVDTRLDDNQQTLDQDNLNKTKGAETLSLQERQRIEDEQNVLRGKPTEEEKNSEISTDKETNLKKKDELPVSQGVPAPEGGAESNRAVGEGISKEYQKAIDEVTRLQGLFNEASQDPTADVEEQYRQLATARHALRQVAPAPKVGVATPRPEKSVKMTPGEAIKHQVQTFYRGMEKGVKKGSVQTKELVNKVRDAIKGYNLTDSQIGVLLTQVKNTNLFTPGSISRLNSTIDKVTTDSLYADKLNRATEFRSKIKKRRGQEKTSRRERDVLRAFSQVDPSMVDIDTYLSQAEKLTQRGAFDINEANQYLSTTPDTNQIRKQDRIEALADRLGLSFEEAQHLLEEPSSPEEVTTKNAQKAKEERDALIESVEQAKTELIDAWEGGEIVAEGKYNSIDLEALKKIDPTLLKTNQLKELINLIDRVTTNEDWGGVGKFTAISRAQQDFKELQKASKGFNILNLNAFEGQIDSLPMALQAITGLPKDAALFQLYMGFKGVNEASVKTLEAEEKFIEGINKLRKTDPKAFENDSVLRQGIYGELIRYNEDEDSTEVLSQNKEVIEQSIQNHIDAGESEEASKIAKLYAPFKDAITVQDVQNVMTKIDKRGKKVIDYAIDFYAPYGEEISAYNDRFFDKKTTKVINYSGPRIWNKLGTGLEEWTDDFSALDMDNQPGVTNVKSKPKQINAAKEFTGAGRTDAVLSFNKHLNMSKGVRNTVFGIEGIMPMLQVRENIGRGELLNILGKKEGDDKSIKKARDLYKKLFDRKEGIYFDFEDHAANRKVPDNFSRSVNSFINPLRKLGYVVSLSGISQIPKQMTVLANVAVRMGADFDLIPFSDAINKGKEIKEFLKGETVSLRGAQKSEFSLGDLVGPEKSQAFQQGVGKLIEKGFEGWLGIKPLVKTDVKVAQMSYIAFYKKYLRDNGEEFKGYSKENEMREDPLRKEARAFAKQQVDVLQVVSNPVELGKQIKNQNAYAQLMKALLIPYGTFSTNTKSRMWADWRAIVSGNPNQRAAGAKDLFATTIEQTTFQTTAAALKIYLWANIGQFVAGMFDLPDDKKKDEKSFETAVKIWQTNMIKDILPIILTAPGEDGMVHLINKASDRFLKYKDPLYQYKGTEDPLTEFADLMGPYGAYPARLYKTGQVVGEATRGTRMVNDKEKKLTPEQKNYAVFMAVLYAMSTVGKMPSDVINALDRERRIQKPGRVKPENENNPTIKIIE